MQLLLAAGAKLDFAGADGDDAAAGADVEHDASLTGCGLITQLLSKK